LLEFSVYEDDDAKLDAVVTSFDAYSEFVRFEKAVKLLQDKSENRLDLDDHLERTKLQVQMKFPVLILLDLGGTIFFRTTDRNVPAIHDFSHKKSKTYKIFLRPGHDDFLLKLGLHPRVKLGFYSSIHRDNIKAIAQRLLSLEGSRLDPLDGRILFWDQKYFGKMRHNKCLQSLAVNHWDMYKDLQLVLDDKENSFCKDNGFSKDNVLMIDSEAEKI